MNRIITLFVLLLCSACGEPQSDTEMIDTIDQEVEEVFELNGPWQYTGGNQGLTNALDISNTLIEDTGDYNGTGWNIRFAVESWDNDQDQALLTVTYIKGFSHYALGESLFMSWQLKGNTADMYFNTEDYQTPKEGTEGSDFFTYTRQSE